MKKIGFIGVYDKTDLILCIAKVLTEAGKKVMVMDATINQKSKYVVPVINPTKSYITEFEKIDVAVGFNTIEEVKQYLGLEREEKLEYDYILVDTDNKEGILNFSVQTSERIYYVTSFDAYSLKKGLEVISELDIPLNMKKIFFSKEMLKEEEEYFNYLALGIKAEWEEERVYFLLENGDNASIVENQRISKIKLKNLSSEYKENVTYLVDEIDKEIGERNIKAIIKNL